MHGNNRRRIASIVSIRMKIPMLFDRLSEHQDVMKLNAIVTGKARAS